jgi:hypothetical protein
MTGLPWDASYRDGPAPWDIGRPQPAIVRLASAGGIAGAVLDAGCGTGENTLHVASLGLSVLGAGGGVQTPGAGGLPGAADDRVEIPSGKSEKYCDKDSKDSIQRTSTSRRNALYSVRSAAIGSTRVARRPGSQAAANDTAASEHATAA